MSTAQRNIDTVKGIYEAFGRGDVPAILERVREDVEWDVGVADRGVPWLAPRRGRAARRRWYSASAANVTTKATVPATSSVPGRA